MLLTVMATADFSDRTHAFASLSLMDLIEARDLFHVHLMKKRNVVATAVGLYLVARDPKHKHEPRTLDNSTVEPGFSWPSVLVFVDDYKAATTFSSGEHPDRFVPRSIYLPDGREIPICIVEANAKKQHPPRRIRN